MYLGHVKVQPACQEAITKQKSEITKKRDKSRHGENGIFQRPTINKYECVRISILTSDDTAALSSAKLTEGENAGSTEPRNEMGEEYISFEKY